MKDRRDVRINPERVKALGCLKEQGSTTVIRESGAIVVIGAFLHLQWLERNGGGKSMNSREQQKWVQHQTACLADYHTEVQRLHDQAEKVCPVCCGQLVPMAITGATSHCHEVLKLIDRLDQARRERDDLRKRLDEIEDLDRDNDRRWKGLEARLTTLREALEGELATHGHTHWDMTMRHGAGCHLCIAQGEAAKKSHAALQEPRDE